MPSSQIVLLAVSLLLLWRETTAAEPAVKDALPPAPADKAWKLVWHDEFDGPKLDESKWVFRPDGRRKDGWWDRKAVALDGKGNLVIRTYRDGEKVVDGCITTQGKFERAFGYYVARVKFQKQPGHWSAFWITGPGVHKTGDDCFSVRRAELDVAAP